jgi:hypothetical protein
MYFRPPFCNNSTPIVLCESNQNRIKTKKESVAMAILVHFKDNNFGYVEDNELDILIQKDAIYAFKLASGWVKVSKGSSN